MNKRLQTLIAGLALCVGLAAPWGGGAETEKPPFENETENESGEFDIDESARFVAETMLERKRSELRQWRGKNETVVEAVFVDVSGDGRNVTLRTADGRIIRTQITNFIDEDQKYVREAHQWIFMLLHQKAKKDFETGEKYYDGMGVRQDFARAIAYYRKAVAFGYRLEKAIGNMPESLASYYKEPLPFFQTPPSMSDLMSFPSVNASFRLGFIYHQGYGVPIDLNRAREYYRWAAERGNAGAMSNLGILLQGEEALFWFRKAAEEDIPEALFNLGNHEQNLGNTALAADYFKRAGFAYMDREDREGALRCLDRLQKIGATALAQMLAGKIYHTPATSSDPPTEDRQAVSMGTGWFCSPTHIVTSWHILQGRESFYISSERFDKIPVRLLVSDRKNDLAVLEFSEKSFANSRFLPLADRLVAAGEHVFTIGFPHITLLGKEPKYTDGTISALSGIGDDPRILQISVPVQAGNSGGPLMNATGEVVGIVASKLAAARVFEWTGDLPQNVNFAVKIDYLRTLLDGRSVKYASGAGEAAPATRSELVERVKSAVVSIIAE